MLSPTPQGSSLDILKYSCSSEQRQAHSSCYLVVISSPQPIRPVRSVLTHLLHFDIGVEKRVVLPTQKVQRSLFHDDWWVNEKMRRRQMFNDACWSAGKSGVKRQVSWSLATGAARRTTQNQWFGEIFVGQTEKMELNSAHRLFTVPPCSHTTANRWGLSSPFQDIPAQSSPGFMWRGLSAGQLWVIVVSVVSLGRNTRSVYAQHKFLEELTFPLLRLDKRGHGAVFWNLTGSSIVDYFALMVIKMQ